MEYPPPDYLAKVRKTDYYGSKLSALASIGVSIPRSKMYKIVLRKVKQLEVEKISEPPSVIFPAASSNNVSSLSSSSPSSGKTDPHESSEPDDSEDSTKPKAGRPKGSSLEKKSANVKSYK